MGKDKLRRFAENLTFECFVQPAFEEAFRRDHPLKGHWHSDFFHNDNPIVLELGCGKGEYTVALAERDPSRNFIGIDISEDILGVARRNMQAEFGEEPVENVNLLS